MWAFMIGLALATAASFFGGYAWWLDISADFKVQYVVAAALLLGATVAMRRKMEAVLALALLITNGWTVYPYIWAPGETPAALKIISFNISYQNPDITPVLDFLRRENADVVVVIEVSEAWRKAFKGLSDIYPHQLFGPPYQDQHVRPHRVGLLAKHQWEETGIEFSEVSSRAYAVWATFPAASPSLTVAGVHLKNPILGPFSHQEAEVDALTSVVRQFSGPVIVAGDFNMTPFSTRYGNLLEETGLRRASGGLNTTWPSMITPLALALDHFLVNSTVKRAAMRVGPRLWSDHRPIIGTFDIGQ